MSKMPSGLTAWQRQSQILNLRLLTKLTITGDEIGFQGTLLSFSLWSQRGITENFGKIPMHCMRNLAGPWKLAM